MSNSDARTSDLASPSNHPPVNFYAESQQQLREINRRLWQEQAIRELMAPDPWLVRVLRDNRAHEIKTADLARWADDGGRA